MISVKQQEARAHAKLYPPSGASRWLSCPASTIIVDMYGHDESDASLKGDRAHAMLENGIVFGIKPDSDDADADIHVMDVLAHIKRTKEGYGPKCQVYAERRYNIPETGEFGTCDVTYVTPKLIRISDYKNGFVEVDVFLNAQLMLYLLGAIAEFGERDKYVIEVLQPNYDHKDGPYRSMEITNAQIQWFRGEVKYAINNKHLYAAGKHCKKSYCPHRGSCSTFMTWAETNGADAWFTSEVNSISDEQLAKALDHAEILQGIRDELRKEAMRRIMNMDRDIAGYKVVKGRKDRQFASEEAIEAVKAICLDLGAKDSDLFDRKFTTVKGIEDFIKQKFKHMGQGQWKKAWANTVAPHVKEYASGLTLDRASGGRPSHSRGSEFGALVVDPAFKMNKVI